MAEAVFAGGCFWCIEAAFARVSGVQDTTVGYTGGDIVDPSYEEVGGGDTGHAEAVRVTYDPTTVTYRDLLEIFFTVHDPTSKHRQGPDVGPQYRPVIFYENDEQREQAETYIDEIAPSFDEPIVTGVEPLDTFYPAEDHHQNYYEKHPNAAYCQITIIPKLENLREKHGEKLQERPGDGNVVDGSGTD